MLKKIFIVMAFAITAPVLGQGTTSPYSFFGIGNLNFRGTVENRLMGGVSTY